MLNLEKGRMAKRMDMIVLFKELSYGKGKDLVSAAGI